MAEPFLSEIRLMSFDFAPKGWAFCNGQLLPINQNQALFALLGTTYGGNGLTTFALPDLRGRVPIHTGGGHILGERGGEPSHTLSLAETATHTHAVQANTNPGTTDGASNQFFARAADDVYGPATNLGATGSQTVANTGGSQAHLNLQPFLALTFCIALQGIFPSQN